MYGMNYIRDILKKYINAGVKKFIIYPFGTNGVIVKNVLNDFFDLSPIYIVDNEYSRYSNKIISANELHDIYQDDMYVIISVEESTMNSEILKSLSGFVPLSNIINLKQDEKEKFYVGGFLLSEFLPLDLRVASQKSTSDKIKVRIEHSTPGMWNAIGTICQAFKEDDIFDVLLIIQTDWLGGKAEKQAQKQGYKYVMRENYQAELDQPDILILNYSFERPCVELVKSRKYAKLIIVASWSVVRYHDTLEMFWRDQERAFHAYQPDYYLYDSLQYREIKESVYFSDKIIEMGNAKYDGIYRAIQNKEFQKEWKKLEDKTTVLWTTSHGIDGNWRTARHLTFDLYAKTFFAYAKDNQNMGFIFRPSPGLIDEMMRLGFWNESDLDILKVYCAESGNIVYDDMDTYDIAFSVADGILTDGFGGMVCSALPTLKPICAAYRSQEDKSRHWHKEVVDNLYSACEDGDIISFFEMIKNKKDPMYESRKKASMSCVKHFDGRNGWRIKEFIKDKYLKLEEKDKLKGL